MNVNYNEAVCRIAYHDSETDAVYARLSDIQAPGRYDPNRQGTASDV